MKKILFFLIFLIINVSGYSQFVNTVTQGYATTLGNDKGGRMADSALIVLGKQSFADTTSANYSVASKYNGVIIYTTSDSSYWIRRLTPNKWNKFNTSAASLVSLSQSFGAILTPNPITGIGTVGGDSVNMVSKNYFSNIAVKYWDTTSMLSKYLLKTDTSYMLSPFVKYSDTAYIVENRLKISDTAYMLSNRVKYSDTANQMSGYLRKNFAVLYTDSANMLSPYLRKSDTANILNPYLLKSDTATMLAPFVQYSDTAYMLSNRLKISDTTYMLSNRLKISDTTYMLSNRLKISDTTTMLSGYLRTGNATTGTVTSVATNNGTGINGGTITSTGTLAIDTLNISTRLWRQKGIDSVMGQVSLKLNISDTTTMLSPFVQYSDTAYMLSNRLKISDTTTMLSGYQRTGNSTIGTVTSIATTAPITGGTITSSGTIGITQATTSTNGYLNSTDWNTFNGKENVLTFSTGLSRVGNTVTNTITQYTDALARSSLSFTAGSGTYNSTTGVITIPTNNNQITNGAGYITGNQTITLSGDVSGSGTTAITTAIGALKVTNGMLAGSIDYAKMNAATVPTWNQNTTGTAASLSAVLSSSLGGAGSVNGILKANGSGVVSAAVAGTDYVAPSALSGYLPLTAGSGNKLSGNLYITKISPNLFFEGGYTADAALFLTSTPEFFITDAATETKGFKTNLVTGAFTQLGTGAFSILGNTTIGGTLGVTGAVTGTSYISTNTYFNAGTGSAQLIGVGSTISGAFLTSDMVVYNTGGALKLLATGAVGLTIAPTTGAITASSSVTASSFIKSGGTSAQILAADGSVITAGTNITISGGTISAASGLTGSGVSGRVAYWNGTGSLTSASGFTYNGNTLSVTATGSGVHAGVFTTDDITGIAVKAVNTSESGNLFVGNNGTTDKFIVDVFGNTTASGYMVAKTYTNNTVSVSTTYSVASDVGTVFADATGGSFTITLPAASSFTGRIIFISRTDCSLLTTLTISGSTNDSGFTPGGGAIYISNGTTWYRVALYAGSCS